MTPDSVKSKVFDEQKDNPLAKVSFIVRTYGLRFAAASSVYKDIVSYRNEDRLNSLVTRAFNLGCQSAEEVRDKLRVCLSFAEIIFEKAKNLA